MSCSEIKIDINTECGDGVGYALARFALKIKALTFDELKERLKDYEEHEFYEYCAIIQQEIDWRIELAAKGWT